MTERNMSDNHTENTMDDVLVVSHVSNHYYETGLGILSRRKKMPVLENVSLRVRRDEFFGIVGESGCGKSTLANCILGLLPYEGEIFVNGASCAKTPRKEFTKYIQAVFQDPLSALDPRKTIGFTMREPLRAHGIGTPEEQKQKVNRMLEMVGLDESYASRYPSELSGGQRQRVCIGAALMIEPMLIIADEAISALDVSVGSQILNLFREIHDRTDFAMLFISHNLNVVYYLCDRIAVLYRGRIVEQGTADEIYHHPVHPYTRLLLSAIPDFEQEGYAAEADYTGESAYRDDVPGACCFYHRCPRACEKCLKAPELINVAKEGEEHLSACHFPEGRAL